MQKFSIIFPGQGSQYLKMGLDLYEKDIYFKKIIDDASVILNLNILDLLNDNEKINKTKYSQILIFLISYSYFQKFINTYKVIPSIIAGHSLGELTALTSAGIISFKDALFILKKRGELMEEATLKSNGKMLAAININPKTLENMCNEIKLTGQYIDIANYNSKNQTVLSGEEEAILNIEKLIRNSNGVSVQLKVNGAFHSLLMEEASNKFKDFISSFTYFNPNIKVLSSVNNKFYSKENAEKILSKQMCNPVLWKNVVENLITNNIELFIEVGPQNILSNLIKADYPNIKCISLERLFKENENFWDYINH